MTTDGEALSRAAALALLLAVALALLAAALAAPLARLLASLLAGAAPRSAWRGAESIAAAAAEAPGAVAEAALPRGVIRTPRSSITISTLPPGRGGSMRTEGLLARPGTAGGAAGLTGSASSLAWLMVRMKRQLKGGTCCSTPVKMSSSTDSSTKRFQEMPTNQLA